MSDAYEIVRTLLRTEKGTRQVPYNKYFFSVKKDANKIQIRRAVEDIYKVKVLDVHTQIVRGKLKRVRRALGRTADWKKAVVTLKEGQEIETA